MSSQLAWSSNACQDLFKVQVAEADRIESLDQYANGDGFKKTSVIARLMPSFWSQNPANGKKTLLKKLGITEEQLIDFLDGRKDIKANGLALTNAELRYVMPFLRSAKQINLRGNRNLSQKVVFELIESVESLKTLNLHMAMAPSLTGVGYRKTNQVLRHLIKHQPQLERLYIDNVSSSGVKLLSQLKSLKYLRIRNTSRAKDGLGQGASYQKYKWLVEQLPDLKSVTFPNRPPLKKKGYTVKNYNDLVELLGDLGIKYSFLSSYVVKKGSYRIIDGDTFETLPPGKTPEDITKLRLYNLDTPEKSINKKRIKELQHYLKEKHPDWNGRQIVTEARRLGEVERLGGEAASIFTETLLKEASEIRVTHLKDGKFGGRTIAEVYLKISGRWFSLSKLHTSNKLAVEYTGDKKAIYDWSEVLNQEFVNRLLESKQK